MKLFLARMDELVGLLDPEGTHFSVCGEPPTELVESLS